LLPGQVLDGISIPFQIFLIQPSTTRFLTLEAEIAQFLLWKPGEYYPITGCLENIIL
jgi:hypothetical protein